MPNKIPYTIELLVDDSKLRQTMADLDWEKILGSKKGATSLKEALKNGTEEGVKYAKQALGGLDVNWSEILGEDGLKQFQKAVAKSITQNKNALQKMINANDGKGIEEIIGKVIELGEFLTNLGSAFDSKRLVQNLGTFLTVLGQAESVMTNVADTISTINTAFGGVAKVGRETTSVTIELDKVLKSLGGDTSKLDKNQRSLQGYKDLLKDITGKKYTISLDLDDDILEEEFEYCLQEIEDKRNTINDLELKLKVTPDDSSSQDKLVRAQKELAHKLLEAYDYENERLRRGMTPILGVAGETSSKELISEFKAIIKEFKSDAKKVIDSLSTIKLDLTLPEYQSFIPKINQFVDNLNTKSEEFHKINLTADTSDGVVTDKLLNKTESGFTNLGDKIDKGRTKILTDTQAWHKEMVAALSFKKGEIDIDLKDLDVGQQLYDAIETYFDEHPVKIPIDVKDLVDQIKLVIEKSGISLGVGGVTGTASLNASAIKAIIESVLIGVPMSTATSTSSTTSSATETSTNKSEVPKDSTEALAKAELELKKATQERVKAELEAKKATDERSQTEARATRATQDKKDAESNLAKTHDATEQARADNLKYQKERLDAKADAKVAQDEAKQAEAFERETRAQATEAERKVLEDAAQGAKTTKELHQKVQEAKKESQAALADGAPWENPAHWESRKTEKEQEVELARERGNAAKIAETVNDDVHNRLLEKEAQFEGVITTATKTIAEANTEYDKQVATEKQANERLVAAKEAEAQAKKKRDELIAQQPKQYVQSIDEMPKSVDTLVNTIRQFAKMSKPTLNKDGTQKHVAKGVGTIRDWLTAKGIKVSEITDETSPDAIKQMIQDALLTMTKDGSASGSPLADALKQIIDDKNKGISTLGKESKDIITNLQQNIKDFLTEGGIDQETWDAWWKRQMAIELSEEALGAGKALSALTKVRGKNGKGIPSLENIQNAIDIFTAQGRDTTDLFKLKEAREALGDLDKASEEDIAKFREAKAEFFANTKNVVITLNKLFGDFKGRIEIAGKTHDIDARQRGALKKVGRLPDGQITDAEIYRYLEGKALDDSLMGSTQYRDRNWRKARRQEERWLKGDEYTHGKAPYLSDEPASFNKGTVNILDKTIVVADFVALEEKNGKKSLSAAEIDGKIKKFDDELTQINQQLDTNPTENLENKKRIAQQNKSYFEQMKVVNSLTEQRVKLQTELEELQASDPSNSKIETLKQRLEDVNTELDEATNKLKAFSNYKESKQFSTTEKKEYARSQAEKYQYDLMMLKQQQAAAESKRKSLQSNLDYYNKFGLGAGIGERRLRETENELTSEYMGSQYVNHEINKVRSQVVLEVLDELGDALTEDKKQIQEVFKQEVAEAMTNKGLNPLDEDATRNFLTHDTYGQELTRSFEANISALDKTTADLIKERTKEQTKVRRTELEEAFRQSFKDSDYKTAVFRQLDENGEWVAESRQINLRDKIKAELIAELTRHNEQWKPEDLEKKIARVEAQLKAAIEYGGLDESEFKRKPFGRKPVQQRTTEKTTETKSTEATTSTQGGLLGIIKEALANVKLGDTSNLATEKTLADIYSLLSGERKPVNDAVVSNKQDKKDVSDKVTQIDDKAKKDLNATYGKRLKDLKDEQKCIDAITVSIDKLKKLTSENKQDTEEYIVEQRKLGLILSKSYKYVSKNITGTGKDGTVKWEDIKQNNTELQKLGVWDYNPFTNPNALKKALEISDTKPAESKTATEQTLQKLENRMPGLEAKLQELVASGDKEVAAAIQEEMGEISEELTQLSNEVKEDTKPASSKYPTYDLDPKFTESDDVSTRRDKLFGVMQSFAQADAEANKLKYTLQSFDGKKLIYTLTNINGEVRNVTLTWDELNKKVAIISDRSLAALDPLVVKVKAYRDAIDEGMRDGLLPENADAEFKKLEDEIERIQQKILSGDVTPENFAALDEARKKAIAYGTSLHKVLAGMKEIRTATAQYNRIVGATSADFTTERQSKLAKEYKDAYDGLVSQYKQWAKENKLNNPEIQSQLQQQLAKVKKLGSTYQSAIQTADTLQARVDDSGTYIDRLGEEHALGGVHQLSVSELENVKGAMEAYAKSLYGVKLEKINVNTKTMTLTGTLRQNDRVVSEVAVQYNKATDSLYAYQVQERESLTGLPGLIRGFKEKSKAILQYVASMTSIYRVFGFLKQGIQYIREIDSALTELKKVTDATEESYDRFLNTAAKTADKVGSTITKLVNSAADWSRIGYSLEEAATLAQSTAILLNVSEFNSIEDATSALTSTLQAFGYTAEQSMDVVDVLNEVGKLIAQVI